MNFVNKFWKSKIAIRFLITYVLLLVIPFSASIMTSFQTRNTIIDISTDNAQKVLEQTAEILTSYLTNAVKTVSVIGMDESLSLIANSTSLGRNHVYYYSIKLMNSLNSFKINNDFYTDMFVILDRNGYIITTNTIYRTNRFYDTFFTYGSLDEMQWKELITQNNKGTFLPAVSIRHVGDESKVIPYVCALNPTSRSAENDCIILMLREERITTLLKSIDLGGQGYVYVTDGDGQIITSVMGEDVNEAAAVDFNIGSYNDGRQDMVVASYRSSDNGWNYVSVIPRDYILRNVTSQFRQTLLLLCFALLVGFVCSLMFTTINMRPLRDVIGTFMVPRKPGNAVIQNEYELIKSHVHSITNMNSDLQSKLDILKPIMHSTVFESILNGTYFHEMDTHETLTYIDLNLTGLKYTVAVVKIMYFPDGTHNFDKAIVSVGGIVAGGSTYLHYSNNKIVLLYADTPEKNLKQSTDGLARDSVKQIKEIYDIDVVFGFSNIYSDVSNLSKAYKEALEVINYLYMGRTVIWYNELPQTSGIYHYPANSKASLINAAHNGNFAEVERIIRKIYYENFINRKLISQMCRQLLNELYVTAFSITESNADNLVELITHSTGKNIEDEFEDIILLFEEICEESRERRIRYKNELVVKIVEYLEAEYTNESISLTSVADCFGLSETYLSHLFKDETGDNFSKYIEKKRIQLACSHIGKMQIKDIAMEVGYANVMTFSRAFRRVKGCNPSEYSRAHS